MPTSNRLSHHSRSHEQSTTTLLSPTKSSPKNLISVLLKSVIMVLIISLFLLFLGVAALAVLHFLIASSALHPRYRRRSATRSSFSSPSSAPGAYSFQDLQKHLPKFRYAAVSPSNATKDCCVCLESFKNGEWYRSLPDCNHMFHQICVDEWLTKVPSCPICRTRVRLDSG